MVFIDLLLSSSDDEVTDRQPDTMEVASASDFADTAVKAEPAVKATEQQEQQADDRNQQSDVQQEQREEPDKRQNFSVETEDDWSKLDAALNHILNDVDNAEDLDSNDIAKKLKEFQNDQPQGPTTGAPVSPEANMWQNMQQKSFHFDAQGGKGNPMAGRWAKWINDPENAAKKEEYKKSVGRESKLTFRADWAKKEYDRYKSQKSFTQSHSHIQRTKGKLLSLPRIAWKEGGGKAGMTAAVRHACRCMTLGAPWVKWDGWTGFPKFMHCEEGFEDLFQQQWEIKKEWLCTARAAVQKQETDFEAPKKQETDDEQPKENVDKRKAMKAEPPEGSGSSEPNIPDAKRAKPSENDETEPTAEELKALAKAKAKAKGKTAAGDPGANVDKKGVPRDPKLKTTMKILNDCKKLRTDLVAARHRSDAIMNNIVSDLAEWHYFKAPANHKDLEAARKKLSRILEGSEFFRQAMSSAELKDLKATHNPVTFESELQKFKKTLDPLLKSLQRECELISQTFSARANVMK